MRFTECRSCLLAFWEPTLYAHTFWPTPSEAELPDFAHDPLEQSSFFAKNFIYRMPSEANRRSGVALATRHKH